MARSAVVVNCTLKPSPAESNTEALAAVVVEALEEKGVAVEVHRALDFDIRPGVTSDEGDGDEWPGVRQKILDADIFVLGTPIWVGNPSSICRRVIERLDAVLGETDDQGRMIATDRVAVGAIVGNEDGAHNTSGQIFQALNDFGFTIPANGVSYWVGEAMGSVDFKDLDEVPEKVSGVIETLARNAAHLAGQLTGAGYPAG